MEEWRNIEGYEGLYQVSNYGRVKSLERVVIRNDGIPRTIKEKIKKIQLYKIGYLYVNLSKNGVDKDLKIHKLVAEAFIPNPHNYTVVHHIDHNPQNNTVENLMWVSKEEHDKLHQTDRASAIKERCSKTVFQYTLDGELVAVWESGAEAAKQLGFSAAGINQCCNGGLFCKSKNKWYNRIQHKGYRWSFEPL